MSMWIKRLGRVLLGMFTACVAMPLAFAGGPHDQHMGLLDLSVTMAAPSIAPQAGNYPGSVTVTLKHSSEDAVIYYTLDGSEPTDKATKYEEPFWLVAGAKVKACAYRKGNHSQTAEAVYGITAGEKVATPTIAPNGGSFTGSVMLTVATATPDAVLYYTLDGSDISHRAARYKGSIWLAGHAIVKVRAFKAGLAPSDVAKGEFLVNFGTDSAPVTLQPAAGTYDNSVIVTMAPGTAPQPSPQPSPTPTPSPEPQEPFVHIMEAEGGTLTAPMAMVDRAGTSQGKVIRTSTAGQGTAVYTVTVPSAGNYYILARIIAEEAAADQFFVKVDSGTESVYTTSDGVFNSTVRWTAVKSGAARVAFPLTAGQHMITFRGDEVNAVLDCVAITNDEAFNPGAQVQMGLMHEEDGPQDHGDLKIVYTLNGLDPSPYDMVYDAAKKLTITSSVVLKARTVQAGKNYGPVTRAEYVIKTTASKLIATVNDRKTDEPIKGATVKVLLPSGREVGKATTGDTGVAEVEIAANAFGNESDKTMKIVVSAPKYVELAKRVLVRKGIDNSIVVDLEPSGQPVVTKLTITVLDDKDKPVAKALVGVHQRGAGILKGETDTMGVVKFVLPEEKMVGGAIPDDGAHDTEPDDEDTSDPSHDEDDAAKHPAHPLPGPDTIEVRIKAKGFADFRERVKITLGIENALKFKLKPFKGDNVTKLIVTVKDEVSKAVVPGAEVMLETGGGRIVKANTDAQGKAELVAPVGGSAQHLPDMAARLTVKAHNFHPYQQNIAVRLGQTNEHEALLKPLAAGTLTKVIIGVTDEATKKPIGGAICTLTLPEGRKFAVVSDLNGECSVVFPKEVLASAAIRPMVDDATHPAPKPAKLTVTAKGFEPYENTNVMLTEGQDNRIAVVLKLSQVGITRVLVTVTDSVTKQPVIGALITLDSPGRGSPQKMFSDQQGKATLVLPEMREDMGKSERPGTLIVTRNGYEPANQTLALKRGQDNDVAVALKAIPAAGVTKIIVTVTNATTTQPVIGASVELRLPERPTLRTVSDGTGVATMVIPDAILNKSDKPGTLLVSAKEYELFKRENVQLTAGVDNAIAVGLKPGPTPGITKIIVSVTSKATQAPVPSALVELIPSKDGMTMRAFTDSTGKAEIVMSGLQAMSLQTEGDAGQVKLTVTARNFIRYVKDGITLKLGEVNELAVALDPLPTGSITKVTVKVTDVHTNLPIAGARIEGRLSDGKAASLFTGADGVGVWVILDEPLSEASTRTAKFAVSAALYQTATKEGVTVERGKETSVGIGLAPKSSGGPITGDAGVRQALTMHLGSVPASNGRLVQLPPVEPPKVEITPTQIRIPAFNYTVPAGTTSPDGSVIDQDFTISVPEIVIPITNGTLKFPGVTVQIPELKVKRPDGTVETIPGKTITVPPKEIAVPMP